MRSQLHETVRERTLGYASPKALTTSSHNGCATPEAILELDLFLSSLMRQSTDLRARLAEAGVTKRDLQRAKEEAREAGLLRPFHVSQEIFADHFGPPMRMEGNILTYALTLWPEHVYEIGIVEPGRIAHRGFVLKTESHISRPASLDLSAVESAFDIGRHTQREVSATLGDAAKIEAWNPMEDWLYGPVDGDLYTVFEFDFGLLSGVTQRRPVYR
jgi:hypothetical protein